MTLYECDKKIHNLVIRLYRIAQSVELHAVSTVYLLYVRLKAEARSVVTWLGDDKKRSSPNSTSNTEHKQEVPTTAWQLAILSFRK